jgi:response regulator RpfG family c-di-GMP phosphodiesterase
VEQAASPDQPEAIKQKTLLLVDDEENILSSLRRLLRKDGYRILCASSGQEGLALLEQEPDIDLIMSDQRMPQMTGTVFLRQARKVSPNSVRIVLSGYTDLESVTEAINEGAVYKFLTKPWDDEILRLSIKEALHYKWTIDENRMLQSMLMEVNQEFASAIEKLNVELSVARHTLDVRQSIINAIPVPVLVLFPSGKVYQANNAALNLLEIATGGALSEIVELPQAWVVSLADKHPPEPHQYIAGQHFNCLAADIPDTGEALRIFTLLPVLP